jgi:16S rRNA (guanine527-N7)-methyltransferase
MDSDATDQGARLAVYAELLRASPHNLLSPNALAELEERHFPESIAFAEGLPPAARVLDVGSGGGLPGVVVAIVRPELEVHLLEATGKKARFLQEAGDQIGIALHVHHGRAEELGAPPLEGSFDIVTARALAPMVRLAGWCAPYLRPGGTLHAIKGERWAEELEDAKEAIRHAGLRIHSTPLSDSGGRPSPHPLVVVLERTGHTTKK